MKNQHIDQISKLLTGLKGESDFELLGKKYEFSYVVTTVKDEESYTSHFRAYVTIKTLTSGGKPLNRNFDKDYLWKLKNELETKVKQRMLDILREYKITADFGPNHHPRIQEMNLFYF